ncbi:MAG: DUF177 domain-containing protein [Firmicutes bacterium]|nr:DUF177 domain-containing protein [Bacillota bacterium]
MLQLELGRLKHDLGYCMPFKINTDVDPTIYGYREILLCAPVSLSGLAENIAGEMHITGQLTANLIICCSRCGAEFPLFMVLPFQEIYSSQDVLADAAGVQDKHSFSGTNIDLTPEALRNIFAELPMKPLCREDCKGLCGICGAKLNEEKCSCSTMETDSRWEILRVLLNDHTGKGV